MAVVIQDPQYFCPAHRHQFCEISIVLSGKALHVVEKTSYLISERDVYVIMGNKWHTFEKMHHLALANIVFDPSVFLAEFNDLDLPGYQNMFEQAKKHSSNFHSRLKLSNDAFVEMKNQLFELKNEIDNQEEGYQLAARSILNKIVVFLSRCYNDPSMRVSGALHRIADVILYIENNYTEPITLETLENVSCMSRRNLSRLFREALDQSPIEYLIRTRIRHAIDLLKNDESKNITEIAQDVGFSDSNYFSRQFRRITGMSPKSYIFRIKNT